MPVPFPWFKDASIAEITRVELPSPHHLQWPDLDIDLVVDSLVHPERYPLVSRVQPWQACAATQGAREAWQETRVQAAPSGLKRRH